MQTYKLGYSLTRSPTPRPPSLFVSLSLATCSTGRLDYYLHVGQQIDLMKIDVEGHELSVVRRSGTTRMHALK